MGDAANVSSAGQSDGAAGVGMFVGVFVDEMAAEQVLEEVNQAKKRGDFYYEEAAVIRMDDWGKVHIGETGDMSTGMGAGIGALIGGVIGLLGGPAGVAVGAGGGAAIGAIAAHHDAGFSNESLKEIGAALLPGTSALAVSTSRAFVEAVRNQVPDTQTLTVAKELAAIIEARLRARQEALFSLVITEQGIVATEVTASSSEVAVFGIAASEDAAAAGGAVATDQGVVAGGASAVAGSEEGDTEDDSEPSA